MTRIPELVAPAGGMETLDAAFRCGADAAYAGLGPHTLRARAPSFSPAMLAEAIQESVHRGKRLYVACNAMPDERQLQQIGDALRDLEQRGAAPDALIVSDPGVVRLCRRIAPHIPLHLSTQAGACNSESLAFWRDNGVVRAVLPRELRLDAIAAFSRSGIVETEAFAHGAMCVSISGRCLLGAYVAGRHPNRGDCPQPCRLSYRITAEHPGAMQQRAFIAEEGERGVYLLNAKDLCTLPILPALAATGVSALKIEGRTKSVHYLVAVVRTYRQALDKAISDPAGYAPDPAWIAELDRIDHRPYTTGFYTGEYRLQSVAEAKTASKTRAVGMVKGFTESGNPVIDVKNPFDAGEELQVCPAQPAASPYTLRVERLTDLAGRAIDRAVTNCLAVIPGAALKRADLLRRVR